MAITKYLIWVLVLGWAGVIYFIFVTKHFSQFQTFGWDTGFFSQVIYKASRGDFSASTISGRSLFSDHFQPILLIFVPFYRFRPDIRWLYAGSALVFSISIFPIYLLATQVLKNKLISIAVVVSYLLLVSTQHGLFDGFSQAVFVAPFLAGAFYLLESGKFRWYWLMVLGMILTKEEFSLLLVPLGMTVFFQYNRRLGILTVLAGALVFWFLIYFLDARLFPGDRNWAHYETGYGAGGQSPQEVIAGVLTKPLFYLQLPFGDPVKLETIKIHFLSFSFLPLFSPVTLIPLAYEYFTRFINTLQPGKWLAHDFDFGVILAVSAIYGAKNLSKLVNHKLLAVVLLTVALAGDLVFHGPINSLFKPQFYRPEPWAKNNQRILSLIPANVSVAANNSLVPHLSTRSHIYQLPHVGMAEYIAVDLHDGPNAYAPIDLARTNALIYQATVSGQYKLAARIGEAYLFQKQ